MQRFCLRNLYTQAICTFVCICLWHHKLSGGELLISYWSCLGWELNGTNGRNCLALHKFQTLVFSKDSFSKAALSSEYTMQTERQSEILQEHSLSTPGSSECDWQLWEPGPLQTAEGTRLPSPGLSLFLLWEWFSEVSIFITIYNMECLANASVLRKFVHQWNYQASFLPFHC